MAGSTQAINIVLDGPPDLTAGSGRFVEVETDDGHSIAIGAWTQRPDGYWSLRIGDTTYKDFVWSYPTPIPEIPKIENLLCFYNEKVDLYVDGVKQEPPVTPFS